MTKGAKIRIAILTVVIIALVAIIFSSPCKKIPDRFITFLGSEYEYMRNDRSGDTEQFKCELWQQKKNAYREWENNQVKESATKQSDWKTYTSDNFTMSYPSQLTASKTENSISFTDNSNFEVLVVRESSPYGKSGNGHFGEIVYTYENGQYMVSMSNEREGGLTTPTPAKPMFKTASGLPVFIGSVRSHGFGKFEYIVALSSTKFLVIYGSEEGIDLEEITKSVKVPTLNH